VEDTVKILNTDEAFDVFDKSVNTAFLQTAALSREEESDIAARRQRAISVLQRAVSLSASFDGSPSARSALVLASVSMDAFGKVTEEIDKLVAELGKQQQDEVDQRDWCTEEFSKNDRSTAAADDQQAALETKIADLEKSVETLTADIEAARNTINEAQTQMTRASENREAENADNQQTISDQRMTQMILKKAFARMKQVYAFLQQPGAAHIATSGNHTDAGNAPARFKEYEQNAKGSKVVAMMETVMADSTKMEEAALKSEEDSQTAYDNFMKDSNKAITRETESIANLSEARAKAKQSLTMAKTDLKRTVEELGGLNEMKGDLHRSCDFVLKNFQARQAARAAEVDALKEAKAILSGMK